MAQTGLPRPAAVTASSASALLPCTGGGKGALGVCRLGSRVPPGYLPSPRLVLSPTLTAAVGRKACSFPLCPLTESLEANGGVGEWGGGQDTAEA